jgi:tetratricopeptide (TPR) repeat protein
MSDASPSSDDFAQEANWTPIPDDDDIWAPPRELPPPLDDPAPPLLNTHQMSWDAFERLVLAMARNLDGAHAAHRYGRPGQAQHGLDVVAFFPEGPPAVYQAKRRQEFGARDLEEAVDLCAQGERPFGLNRIVIAVSRELRDAETIETLHRLTETYPEVRIELWDQEEISNRLSTQPNLVTRFFGRATAAAFCSVSPPPAPTALPPSIAADAILRGPIAHLQLGDDLARAEGAMEADAGEAAHLFGVIADRLEAEGFVPHAAPVREQQARALHATDRREDEARIRIDLGWQHLALGDAFSALVQVREIAEWGDEAPDEVVRSANALGAAATFRHEHALTLDQLAESFDEVMHDDRHRVDAAVVLAEEAIAARRCDLVAARAEAFQEVANALPQDDANQLLAARLRVCIADCTGGWDELGASARDTYAPRIAALVLARYARHLALIPEPEQAIARWRDAIERACLEGLNDDAADWLYAVRAIRVETGFRLLEGDINEPHRHAQALRAAGGGSVMPEPYSARERGLASLRDEKWPDALSSLRRYLWRSTIGADWSGEIDAHELLGDLFLRIGRSHDALRHYVFAGQSKKLEALAGVLRDDPVRLPIGLMTTRPWERTAAFSFAAAAADLIVDEDAIQWCEASFREVVERPQPAPLGAPDPWLAAFKAFGQLAIISTDEQARGFLEMSSELIPREPNRYRFTDEAHVHALVGIARAHPNLRAEAIDHLLQAILVDGHMADLALRHAGDLLRDDPNRTIKAVREAAVGGNHYAAFAIIAAAADMEGAVPLARTRLEAAIAPRVHEPGVQTFGSGLAQTAALVTALPEGDRIRFARGMIDFANDEQETFLNRAESLIALQVIARHIPDEVRDELFEAVMPFAEGQRDAGGGDLRFPPDDDPLARFRVSLGESSLSPAGLRAASALARSAEQYQIIQRAALAQLRGADDRTANSVAAALASIPAADVGIPVEVLATHTSSWMRALAAVIWAQRPDLDEQIGVELARDPSKQVRASLAKSIGDDPRHAPCKEILAGDARRSLRWEVSKT